MSNAPGFMFYDERFRQFDCLSDAQAGKVIKAAGLYKTTGEIPKLSKIETIVFIELQRDIDRSTAQYDVICERNRTNGAKGGRPPKKVQAEFDEDFEAKRQRILESINANPT